MVVDDEKDILEVVAIVLQMKGFEVIAYDNADHLLEKLEEEKPDVILLDVQLGSYDGRQLCKSIKEVKEYAHIPVILFSANNHYKLDLEKCQCVDFIEKPFDINHFVSRINHYAQQH